MNERKSLLEVRSLSIAFPEGKQLRPVVRSLSFDIPPGRTLCIVGESGSGKSMTSLALMGLLPHTGQVTSGTAHLDGRDLLRLTSAELREIRGNEIGMIFQDPMTSLNPVLTIERQLTEGQTEHRGLTRAEATQHALDLLDRVRIPAARRRLRQYPHELSGGMRQRVMIAMALACEPRLLIADEPTTAVDVTVQAQILGLLEELRKDLDMAIMLITHDMGVVAEMADRVVVMRGGEHIEAGAVERIFKNPQASYTKLLLDAVPRLGKMSGVEGLQRFSDDRQLTEHRSAEGSAPVLEVEDLTVRFGIREGLMRRIASRVHAAEAVSFKIQPGESLSLVGESGSGKTTVARAILNLIKPTAGTVRLRGQDITGLGSKPMRPHRRTIQVVFQDPYATLDPRMTVGAQVAEPLRVHQLASGSELEDRTAALFRRVGLDPTWMRRYGHEFSGGQRQRICIARALSLEPRLIIADEAVSALDVSVQAQVLDLLMDLQEENGLAYLFISHDLAVVERISHRVVVMYLGRVVEIGSRAAVLENPQHPYTRSLLQAVPIANPEQRPTRNMLSGDVPNPMRPANYVPPEWPMRSVGPDHRVALGNPAEEISAA